MRGILMILTVFVAMASFASAQDTSPLKALQTGNDSRGWEAVGRLNIAGRAFCTGALIAPDLVLTAAHCMFDPDTGRSFAAKDIEFLAGWRNGRANAVASVRRAIPHPKFEYKGNDRTVRVAYDVALLELQRPIRKSSVTPFETGVRPRKGATVGVVSYGRGREKSASLQESCRVLARRSGTLVLSCDVQFGSSGAPIFTISEDGTARIVSVVSAKADASGQDVALGTSLQAPLADLMTLMAEGRSEPGATGTVRMLSLGGGKSTNGAKFMRP